MIGFLRHSKFHDTKILIYVDNELPGDITLKNSVILMTYIMKDDAKFFPRIFLEKARWWDWCILEDDKKEVKPYLINQK